MYAGKNKSRKSRNVATDEESLKLSSTDSRYDAGDYEAVPASIRKVRDARRKEQKEKQEEANAIPASEIIAQQEAEIERLKKQVEEGAKPMSLADRYRSAVDDNEEHPTFKNPASMEDFGDYEAVAASARLDAANHDPDQKVFRAKPAVKKVRKIAEVTQLEPGDYEAVAAGARRAVPPDEYVARSDESEEPAEEAAPAAQPAAAEETAEQPAPEDKAPEEAPAAESYKDDGEYEARAYIAPPEYKEPEPEEAEDEYMSDAEAMRISSASPAFSREVPEYTAPEPEEEPEPEYTEEEYTAPAPPPAPVSAADYTVEAYSQAEEAPKPVPAPISAADYMVKPTEPEPAPEPEPVPAYTPEPAPAYTPEPAPAYTPEPAPEPYTPPRQRSASGDYIHSEPYVLPSQRGAAPESSSFTRQSTSGRRIADVADIAPGDYEAVAVSSADDSDLDLADGSYDFDKYLANAPTLQMYEEPEVSPEEIAWTDISSDNEQPDVTDEPDITDEQTRALTEAIAHETLTNQPGTEFEDIIDNVIAKVLERKKAEDAAKAAEEQKAEEQPEQKPEEKPAEPEQKAEEKPAEQEQKPEEPKQEEAKREEPEPTEPAIQEQPEEKPREFHPDFIPDDTPLDDIPALIVAELDSIEGDVSEDEIKQAIDTALISKLTAGALTLDSVQPARNKILDEIKEMQEEEARILAELSGEKHEFRTDFLPHDIKLEDIPDAIINELDSVEGDVSDDDVKKAIDTVLIAKLAAGELTLDSYQSSRDDIFDSLGIEQKEVEEKAKAEPEPEEEQEPEETAEIKEEPEEESTEEPEPEEVPAEPAEVKEEPEEEPEEEAEPEEEVEPEIIETINTENVHYEIDTPELEPVKTVEEESPAPAEEAEEKEEEAEEEEEQTVPIPVPKEPTVLEYDPYADKFVNPEPEEPLEEETTEDSSENEPALEENAEAEESDVESVPLSAAAVLAMQGQEELDEEPETETETSEGTEPEPEEEPTKESEPETEEEAAEETVEEPEEEPTDEPIEELAEKAEPEIEAEPVEEPEPEAEYEKAEEPETEPEHEEPAEEPEQPESDEPDEEAVGKQMTIDDIFRNPFVNDFEPLEFEEPEEKSAEEHTEEPEEIQEEQTEEPEESVPAEEPEAVEEPAETPDEELEAEPEQESTEEPAEEPEAEPIPDPEPEIEEKVEVEEIFAQSEEEIEKAKAEEEAKAAEEAKAKTKENLEKYGVDFVTEEEQEPEEQEEYNEAKAERHNAMQDALLMAMIDGSEKTFSDAVHKIMDREDLSARTLMSRMPIDRVELDKVLDDPDYKPDKKTALAICFALRLTWEDSIRMLYKAGHVLSDSQRFDLTIEYLLRRGVYDQNMINSVLRGSGLEGFGIPQSEI